MEEKKGYKGNLVVSSNPKALPRSSYRQITAIRNRRNVKGAAGHVAIFLLKVAALETVRRVSKAKCPFLWRGFQALQVICYPPFNFVQKWVPFKGLVKGMQMLSRPLLVLSIATSLSDQEELVGEASVRRSGPLVNTESHSEEPSLQPALDASNHEASQNLECESWLDKLHMELENQGISLPERAMVVAAVSQVEHGIMYLVSPENPEVTVLVDCEGLSPFKIPMQVMRSCSSLLQDHYPNRLGCLFVIRLPSVVRVIAQTFIQVLKPTTRKKLKIGGETYRKILLENLQTLPSYLGGDCRCTKCLNIGMDVKRPRMDQLNKLQTNEGVSDSEDTSELDLICQDDIDPSWSYDQVLRTAIIGLLMFWVLIAVMAGLSDPEFQS
ncbi:hypothetical protein Goshw_010010 [Gossypium schwendimanii]|uniref:CRAL-TRIO domain-containing protein n=2 Tax=Gossypium TaxID=3633 RepID=A0A7J9KX03_GOSSC|nr:hypothetical protein [Gossypium schwendimanii]